MQMFSSYLYKIWIRSLDTSVDFTQKPIINWNFNKNPNFVYVTLPKHCRNYLLNFECPWKFSCNRENSQFVHYSTVRHNNFIFSLWNAFSLLTFNILLAQICWNLIFSIFLNFLLQKFFLKKYEGRAKLWKDNF